MLNEIGIAENSTEDLCEVFSVLAPFHWLLSRVKWVVSGCELLGQTCRYSAAAGLPESPTSMVFCRFILTRVVLMCTDSSCFFLPFLFCNPFSGLNKVQKDTFLVTVLCWQYFNKVINYPCLPYSGPLVAGVHVLAKQMDAKLGCTYIFCLFKIPFLS